MGRSYFDLDFIGTIGGARDAGSRAASDFLALLLPVQSTYTGPFGAVDRLRRAASGHAVAFIAVEK